MAWEIDRRDFSVRLTNEFGQYATGDSQDSFEAALALAQENAAKQKPPVYRPRELVQVQIPKSIDNFI